MDVRDFTKYVFNAEIIMGVGLAIERRRYNVTPSLIGWPHTGKSYIATTPNIPWDLCKAHKLEWMRVSPNIMATTLQATV